MKKKKSLKNHKLTVFLVSTVTPGAAWSLGGDPTTMAIQHPCMVYVTIPAHPWFQLSPQPANNISILPGQEAGKQGILYIVYVRDFMQYAATLAPD